MIKKFILFGGLISSLFASSIVTETDEIVLKSTAGKNDIMNLDSLFETHGKEEDFNKMSKGKGKKEKEKERKKKPKKPRVSSSSSSSSSEDDRRSNRNNRSFRNLPLTPPTTHAPPLAEPIMRQQDANVDRRYTRHASKEEMTNNNDAITITGPIRRKPITFPN